VNYTFGSFKGLMQTAKAIFSSEYKDADAEKLLNEWQSASHMPLVQIGNTPAPVVVTTSVDENVGSVAGD
jgi:hypothetical protein